MAKVEINIREVNLVVSWNILTDPKDESNHNNCMLCRKSILAPSFHELQIEPNKDINIEGKLLKGRCGDVFHARCMNDFLKSGSISCPTCNVPWQQSKILNSRHVFDNVIGVDIKKKT